MTSNAFVIELFMINDVIEAECRRDDNLLKPIAENIKAKYWRNLTNMNMLLFVAIALDPRYKLKIIEYVLFNEFCQLVRDYLSRLFDAYEGGVAVNVQGSR